MNFFHTAVREYYLWRQYPRDRLRWLLRERRNPLSGRTFQLGDKAYEYFVHPYNHTWENERAVEIPVAVEFLKRSASAEILEVGNVLSHYFDMDHMVLDLYEKCRFRPVIKEDVVDFCAPHRFSSIVSISTIEHVGWDEEPRRPEKVVSAFRKLRAMLAPTGTAMATVPVGYNRFLDDRLREGEIDCSEIRCLKRTSDANEWAETDLQEALKCKYDYPFRNANAVVFILLSGFKDVNGRTPGTAVDD